MLPEFGHILLITAFVLSLAQACIPLVGAHRHNIRYMELGDRVAIAQFLLIALSFGLLTVSFISSDFSTKLVAMHSHTDKPLIYKISGVWGNHEGSMMLWVLILAFFGALVPVYGKILPMTLKARALAVQGMIGAGFLAFILFTSNPFLRLDPSPLNGQGLNPLLQDPGLAIHPPFLYLGYVGFSIAFSFSVAALIEGRVDAVWAQWLRPWVLLAWSFLTIGITLGSVWAYYELGWGGWWMWDPVENVSFMPWLVGTALLHSIMMLGTRHTMASWTVLLGIAAFSLSLIGTFVVRSGVLVSVHAFAVDPARGVFILALLLLLTGGALALYALRANTLRGAQGFRFMSREGGLILNNILLIIATATVFLGTFYPLLIDAIMNEKITVGKPYFDLTFAPIMILLIGFMGFGPLLKWRGNTAKMLKKFAVRAAVIIIVIWSLFAVFGKTIFGGMGLALAAYLAYGTLKALGQKIGWGQHSLSEVLKRLKAQPAAVYGFLLAHIGVAIFTAGATIMSVWAVDEVKRINIGETISVAGYDFTLKNIEPGRRDNYEFLSATFDLTQKGHEITTLKSEQRFYQVRNMVTTEAGFHLGLGPTLFASISEGDSQRGWVIRAYYHPFIIWIWVGAFLMALAGFVSLTDRRFKQRRVTSNVMEPDNISLQEGA